MTKRLPASEFEGSGPEPFGGFNLLRAEDKARFMKRTEEDPETATLLDVPADRYLHGGIPEHSGDPDWWVIK